MKRLRGVGCCCQVCQQVLRGKRGTESKELLNIIFVWLSCSEGGQHLFALRYNCL